MHYTQKVIIIIIIIKPDITPITTIFEKWWVSAREYHVVGFEY